MCNSVRGPWQRVVTSARKIGVAVVGALVVGIGIAMIVLPGPAFVVIPLGLWLLATEFVWAQRCFQKVRRFVENRFGPEPGAATRQRKGPIAALERALMRWCSTRTASDPNARPSPPESQTGKP